MAGLVPAISASDALSGIEIPGTRPGMTVVWGIIGQPFQVPASSLRGGISSVSADGSMP
jgi:hypothetical protein